MERDRRKKGVRVIVERAGEEAGRGRGEEEARNGKRLESIRGGKGK